MARPQIRQGQLITTFGPGAMTDLPELQRSDRGTRRMGRRKTADSGAAAGA